MSEFIRIGKKRDFPTNRATGIVVEGKNVCVANHEGRLYAFDDRCTHAESLLSAGDLEECEIVCPLHGARFSIETGAALTLPAVRPVRTHDIKVEGEDVSLRLKEPLPDEA